MKNGWRWFGPQDAISLREIRQAGVTDIVTALHHVRCGELWTEAEIAKRVSEVDAAGMRWSVVESVPVHESIKTRSGNFQEYIGIYKQSLVNLAKHGVKIVCYNFMPVLDWTRTDLAMPLPDGSSVLHCDADAICAFDLFILQRPGAEAGYTAPEITRARTAFDAMDEARRKQLSDGILLGLPGTVDDLSREEFLEHLSRYDGIDDATLRANLYAFLNELMPLCEELGIRMAIHPDDPPRPIFGLPRIMSTAADVEQMIREVPSRQNGLTFCTGSFGARQDNAVAAMMERFADRVYFGHLRNVTFIGDNEKSFHESDHLHGHTDMARVIRAINAEEARRKAAGQADWEIVIRPDHGKLMDCDLDRKSYPGYSYGGRMKGLAELRGLETGLQYMAALGHQPLAGKVAIVTGGAGVLCSVLTESLLRAGAKVAILDLKVEVAEEFRAALAAKGLDQAIAIGANVLERPTLEAARDTILATWGRIDILLNGAGGNHPKGTCSAEQFVKGTPMADSFFGLDIAGFEFVNRLNFIGTLLPSQVFGEAMLENGGNIVNISSMSAYQPMTKVAAYSAAKAGVENFTRWLATHLAPMNIRVNAIAPGFFITNQNRFLLLEQDEKTLTPRGHKVINKTPMRRFGDPSDLCGAVKFLVSDEASFITGIVIAIDGGFLAYSGV